MKQILGNQIDTDIPMMAAFRIYVTYVLLKTVFIKLSKILRHDFSPILLKYAGTPS